LSTTVVNIRRAAYDIYIGRSSYGEPENLWGNPFSHLPDSRAQFIVPKKDEVLVRYEAWLRAQPELMGRARRELRDRVLGCFCRPVNGFQGRLMCHGQILAGLVDDVDPRNVP
jgi:hypothetical protein